MYKSFIFFFLYVCNLKWENMNKYVIIFILLLIAATGYLFVKNKKLNEKYETSVENIKAYDNILSNTDNENRVLKLTVEQLNYYNDSILQKINEVRKELKIKDSNLKQMQYLSSVSTKKDTVLFTDTIFKDKGLALDTIIGDKWYNIRLKLKYPNLVYTEPTFTSEKYIIVNKKRETVNPPKKFFLFRWFQRKHWVMEVHIKEKNPYIKEVNNKFVEIIE